MPAQHPYALGILSVFLSLVLEVATSRRCASRVLELLWAIWAQPGAVPRWETGRWWVLRVGYYKLTRPKEPAEDWVGIVDHTSQLGTHKCLLSVGLRLSALPARGQWLRHEEVEPLVLEPVVKSTGELVYQQLAATLKTTGVPREIISDRGGDVQAGVEQVCAVHPATCAIYDSNHKTAAGLKAELEGDLGWQEFTQLCQQPKPQVQQTALAWLRPPNQRTKARWLNVDIWVRWGTQALAVLDTPAPARAPSGPAAQLEEKLGWIRRFRAPLQLWAELLQLVPVTAHFVRTQGLARGAAGHRGLLLAPLAQSPRGQQMRAHLLAVVAEEAQKAPPKERLLGSSEVIEAVFGQFNRLEPTQAKSGFTALILTMRAMVATTTREVIHKALETVPTRCVLEWSKKTLGDSLQAQRKKAFGLHAKTEHKCAQEWEAA